MNLLVVSDLHLGPATQERNLQYVNFLQDALTAGDRVVIAGDLFDLWFGWDEMTFDYQRELIRLMKEFANTGLILDYVEGNRDFGIGRYRGTIFRKVADRSLTIQWDRRSVEIVHGDLINRRDKQYLTWRAASKSRLSYFLIDNLPSSFLLRFAARLESGMRKTNRKYRLQYPEDQAQQFYLERFHNGARIVVAGHFHEEREVVSEVNGKRVLFYNLPGWEKGLRYLIIPPGEAQPYFTNYGR